MTFEEYIHGRLTDCAMFPEQVTAVIERVKSAPDSEAVALRWSDRIEDYPPFMVKLLWLTVKHHALEYIDSECPEAWFRPLFDEGNP